ncbi:sugar ABC transporter, partial [Candidatus Pelagibacter ubique]|nr:sugar ABC transporter [Candidatus Pelagibacter ubique]
IVKENDNLIFLAQNAKDNHKIKLSNQHTNVKTDEELLLGIRPEHIFFKKEHAVRVSKDENFAEIQVKSELKEYVGHEQIITFNYEGQEILGKFSSSIEIESGKEITLYVDLNNICFFDQAQNSI